MPFCHLTLRAAKPRSPKYPHELNTLGDHIRAKRMRLGWHQKDAAKHLGVDADTIWRWERNESRPMVHHIPAIIQFLGYSPFAEPDSLREKFILKRKLLGLSQKAMARWLRVDPTTIACFEKGSRRVSRKLEETARGYFSDS